jgi:hypothetical protein
MAPLLPADLFHDLRVAENDPEALSACQTRCRKAASHPAVNSILAIDQPNNLATNCSNSARCQPVAHWRSDVAILHQSIGIVAEQDCANALPEGVARTQRAFSDSEPDSFTIASAFKSPRSCRAHPKTQRRSGRSS